MFQKDNIWKVLQVFFNDPLPEGMGFQLREISRKVKIAPPSVKRYLKKLEKEGFITRTRHRIHSYPVYHANRDNEKFRWAKKIDIILRMRESGLLEHLGRCCMPEVIILFGSAAQGEDTKESDVDLYLQCKKEKVELKRFETILERKISILFNSNLHKLSNELKNNILNGIILKGYIKVF